MASKEKDLQRISAWRKANPNAVNRYNRTSKLNRLGITEKDCSDLFEKQDFKCAVDGCRNEPGHIDHDHKTGKIRGILCRRCNTAIGMFGDDSKLLIAAACYLDSRQEVPLLGGKRLHRKPVSEEALNKLRDRMKGNKFAIGNRASTGRAHSAAERAAMSARGKERWAKMSLDEQERWRNNGRNNAQKRWRVGPSETQA